MESTSSRKQQKLQEINKLELIDYYSFLSSFIFHCTLLIIMALIHSEITNNPSVLHLSFIDNSDDIIDEDIILELPETITEVNRDTIDTKDLVIEHSLEDTPTINTTSIVNDILDNSIKPIIQAHTDYDLISEELELKTLPITENTPDLSTTSSNDVLSELIKNVADGLRNNDSSIPNPGMQDDMALRLKNAGAQAGDVTISIAWDTIDDIDLHVHYAPGNGLVDQINWTNRIGRISGGTLDVDMNANFNEIVRNPVENIFWPQNSSPHGSFIVYVHFYRSWSGNNRVPVRIVLKRIGEEPVDFKHMAVLGLAPQKITSFRYNGAK